MPVDEELCACVTDEEELHPADSGTQWHDWSHVCPLGQHTPISHVSSPSRIPLGQEAPPTTLMTEELEMASLLEEAPASEEEEVAIAPTEELPGKSEDALDREDEDGPCQLHCCDSPCVPLTGPVVAVSVKGAGVDVEKTY